jgi:hypothetical protein
LGPDPDFRQDEEKNKAQDDEKNKTQDDDSFFQEPDPESSSG